MSVYTADQGITMNMITVDLGTASKKTRDSSETAPQAALSTSAQHEF